MTEQILRNALDRYDIPYRETTRDQLIKCPVHDEDVASCSVNLLKGLWHCFACNQSGDGYTLLELREGIGFVEAQRILGQKADGDSGTLRGRSARKSRSGVPVRAGSARGGRWVPPRLREGAGQ